MGPATFRFILCKTQSAYLWVFMLQFLRNFADVIHLWLWFLHVLTVLMANDANRGFWLSTMALGVTSLKY